ncbi:MAG TPA: hypothetical protein VI916_06040 [Acidimicrobiia bacterium]|nr:hypothetical protein [Acidimicrobiia bacterium]
MHVRTSQRLGLRMVMAGALVAAAWLVPVENADADHGFVCVGPATVVTITVPHMCVP